LDKPKRAQLGKIGLQTFLKKFNPDQLLQDFQAYAIQNGLPARPVQWTSAQKEIARFLKARIARQLFDDKGYYAVINQEDPTVQAALKSIKGERKEER
jgi:carboxyl-terminal processing protease